MFVVCALILYKSFTYLLTYLLTYLSLLIKLPPLYVLMFSFYMLILYANYANFAN